MYTFVLLLFWPVWILLVLFLFGFWLFILALLMAQMGYLHLVSALKRCSSSSCNTWGVVQTVAALWYRVPATVYLGGIVWWLSHCRYRSVWVVFLNTDVFKLPSSSGVSRMSRKGIDPSSLTSSQVNFILGCIKFRCCRQLSLLFFLIIVNVSSRNLFHRIGGVVDVLMAWISSSSMNKFATNGLIGEPMAAPSVCSWVPALKWKIGVSQAKF